MTAGETAVEGLELPFEDDPGGVHVRQEHGRRAVLHARHYDCEAGTVSPGDQPFATADEVVVAVTHGDGLQHRRIGTGTRRRLGHGEAGADPATDQGTQPAIFLRRGGHLVHQVDVAFVRCVDIQCDGAQRRITRLLEDDRLGDVAQACAAHFATGVGAQQTGQTGLFQQLLAQVFAGAVRRVSLIGFHGDHLLGDKGAGLCAQVQQLLGNGEVHGGPGFYSVRGAVRRGARAGRGCAPLRFAAGLPWGDRRGSGSRPGRTGAGCDRPACRYQ
ncbi:hypothetical protein D3C76_973990 [compost metagenome]